MGRAVSLPPALAAALEAVFGESVRGVKLIEHSLIARLHPRVRATTRRERIYLAGGARQFFADPELLLHEYCHVLRQWRSGTLTVPRYLIESLRHGYWNNRFEIEARAFATAHAAALRGRLAAASVQ